MLGHPCQHVNGFGQRRSHTTSTVARDTGISLSSASQHLAALRAASLVSSRRTGGTVVHRATPLGARPCA